MVAPGLLLVPRCPVWQTRNVEIGPVAHRRWLDRPGLTHNLAVANTRRNRTSRWALWGFMVVVAFTTAQITWWGVFIVQQARSAIETQVQALQRERNLAEAFIDTMARSGDAWSERPGAWLQDHFPGLAWSPGVRPGVETVPGFPGYGVVVREERLQAIQDRHGYSIRMLIGEGSVFLAILLTGAFLILRTLRREVRLMERESNFLASVTHELRSPIAAIRLYVETMEMRDLPREKRAHFLANIRMDLHRLETLVSDVLTAARLDAGGYRGSYATSDLATDVRELMAVWTSEAQAAGVHVETSIPSHPVPVRYDLQSLEAIMRNLLDNAVKYGGEDKCIYVAVAVQGEQASITVRDEGIGLEPGELKLIFDKFYRVGDEIVRDTKGTGLGLYIVRELARDLGGEVSVASSGLGRGTEFKVKLPLLRKAA